MQWNVFLPLQHLFSFLFHPIISLLRSLWSAIQGCQFVLWTHPTLLSPAVSCHSVSVTRPLVILFQFSDAFPFVEAGVTLALPRPFPEAGCRSMHIPVWLLPAILVLVLVETWGRLCSGVSQANGEFRWVISGNTRQMWWKHHGEAKEDHHPTACGDQFLFLALFFSSIFLIALCFLSVKTKYWL